MAKILVVDDSKFMRNMIKGILKELGHVVAAEASNGAEAVSMIYKHSPDVVTIDITMPDMDGLTALKIIRGIDKRCKIIMVSAMGQQAMIAEALSAGADDFIVKPFEKDRVAEAINRILL